MSGRAAAGAAGARPDLAHPGAEQPLKREERSLCRRCCEKIQYAVPRRLGAMNPLKGAGQTVERATLGRYEVPEALPPLPQRDDRPGDGSPLVTGLEASAM
eukprot:159955-Pyramimonas_sp.AAC.1